MSSNVYTNLADVRLFNQDDDMDEDLVVQLIAGVSRAIDRYCHRVFFTTTEERLYDWTGTDGLRLRDDLVSLTSVATNAGQTFAANKFVLEPRIGPPYARLTFKDGLGLAFQWSLTKTEAITVAGVWGYKATVPEDIVLACKAWVSDVYVQAGSRGLDSMSGGGVRAAMRKLDEGPPPDVKGWLDHYKKPSRIGVLVGGL
jgi:hypothetical protein